MSSSVKQHEIHESNAGYKYIYSLKKYYRKLDSPIFYLPFIVPRVHFSYENFYMYANKSRIYSKFKFDQCFNSDKRYIAFLLIIYDNARDRAGHANMIIIDKDTNVIERFEPYGNKQNFYDSSKVDKSLLSHFSKYYDVTLETYNSKGVQYYNYKYGRRECMDPDGFCLYWCLWYLELKLKHEKPMDLAIDEFKKMVPKNKFTNFIRNYYRFVNNYLISLK